MPRFALLEHDHPQRHWDLLLEHGPVCRTWRLSAPPGVCVEIEAEAIADHRLMYLDYEGPVSGNRGSVAQWDAGTFVWQTDEPDRIAVDLVGRRCSGRLDLVRTDNGWHVRFTPPEKMLVHSMTSRSPKAGFPSGADGQETIP